MRPDLSGSLHGELLSHDLAVTIALTGELPARVVVLKAGRRVLHCRIDLPSGRSCESTMQLRADVAKRRVVRAAYAGGAAYTWDGDRLSPDDEPGRQLLEPELEDPLGREVLTFRSAIAGTGPRMVDDQRLSVGITRLLHDVDVSVDA